MMESESFSLTKLSMYLFKYSLIIGTAIFLIYLFSQNTEVIIFGFVYLCLATVLNLMLFLSLLIMVLTDAKSRIETLKSMGLLLINIPIAILYFFILLEYPQIFI
jgi:hypothetical protein